MNFGEFRFYQALLSTFFFYFKKIKITIPKLLLVHLRVFLSIFDQTLTAHFLNTDDAKTNRFLLMKQLTPKVHDDSISDDNAPSSGSNELIKFKLQTLSTFATVIRFSCQYHHSTGNWTGFQKWVLILKFFVKKRVFWKIIVGKRWAKILNSRMRCSGAKPIWFLESA